MKKLAGCLLVVAFASTSAFGGMVEFAPAGLAVTPGTPVDMTMSFVSDGGFNQFGGFDAVVGSNDVDFDFAYDAGLVLSTLNAPLKDVGLYLHDYLIGGNNAAAGTNVALPIAIGHVSVDTTGLPEGDYTIMVDFGSDGLSQLLTLAGAGEALGGSGTFTVVPEPATLALLGIGGIVALRRRR